MNPSFSNHISGIKENVTSIVDSMLESLRDPLREIFRASKVTKFRVFTMSCSAYENRLRDNFVPKEHPIPQYKFIALSAREKALFLKRDRHETEFRIREIVLCSTNTH